MAVCMLPFMYFFLVEYFSWKLVVVVIVYSMIIMSTHGTIWFHRYCTHKSYKFSHPIWRFITQNLVIKTFPEEIYVVSHHVHHALSDPPSINNSKYHTLQLNSQSAIVYRGVAMDPHFWYCS